MTAPRTVDDFTGPCKQSGQQLNYRNCPVCGSTEWKLYIDPATGKWFCFAGGHSAGGVVDVGLGLENPGAEILRLLDGTAPRSVRQEVSLSPFEPLSRQARRYLKRRGLDEQEIRRYGLVEWAGKFRLLIPYYSCRGQLVFWNSRRYSDALGDGPKYICAEGDPALYWADPMDEDDSRDSVLVVVEGVFDAWAVARAGYNAVALGGKTLRQRDRDVLLTNGAEHDRIVVMLDPDALAQAVNLRNTLAALTSTPVQVVALPPPKDPGDMTPAEIQGVIR